MIKLSKLKLILLCIFILNALYINAQITINYGDNHHVGDISDGNFSLTYSSPGAGEVAKIWGPTSFTYITSGTASPINVSGLEEGSYTFFYEKYLGAVDINVENGTITVPSHTHNAVVNPDTVSVSIEADPEEVISLQDATVTIPAGTTYVSGSGYSVTVVVDKSAPVITSDFYNLSSFKYAGDNSFITNQATHKISGIYADNYTGGSVILTITNSELSTPITVTAPVGNRVGAFELNFNLFPGTNTLKLSAYDGFGPDSQNKFESNPITVLYDDTPPITDQAGVVFTPDIRGKIIGSKNYTCTVTFTEENKMDTTISPYIEIKTQKGTRINVLAHNETNGWKSDTSWEGEFSIPSGQGYLLDGEASLTIKDAYDKSGNLMTTYTETNFCTIDTTAPSTNNIIPPAVNFVEIISPADNSIGETEALRFVVRENMFVSSFSGVDTAELVIKVDANGNGVFDANESLQFNNANTELDGTYYDGNYITIDPTQLPNDKFNRYSGDKIKVEIEKLEDLVAEDLGGPNATGKVTFELDVDITSIPTGRFVFWDTMEVTNTPPNEAYTNLNKQNIRFAVSPAYPIESDNYPQLAIDTQSVTITINSVPFSVKDSNNPTESDGLTIVSTSGTGEVIFLFEPEKSTLGSLSDGIINVKIYAKDKNGQSMTPVSTMFYVDTKPASLEYVSPLNGWTSFDNQQEIVFDISDETPGQISTIEVIITNNYSESDSRTYNLRSELLRAGTATMDNLSVTTSENGFLYINLVGTEVYKKGSIDASVTIWDLAGNKTVKRLKFWMIDGVKLESLNGTQAVGENRIDILGAIKEFPEGIETDTNEVLVIGQLVNAEGHVDTMEIRFNGKNNISISTSGDNVIINENGNVVVIDDEGNAVTSVGGVVESQQDTTTLTTKGIEFIYKYVKLIGGNNNIRFTLLDNWGHKMNFNNTSPSDISLDIVYDNVPPNGNLRLELVENKKSYAEFKWNEMVDEHSNPVSYVMEVAVEKSFSTIFKSYTTTNTTYILSMEDFPYNNYYVRLAAEDSVGNRVISTNYIIIGVDSTPPEVANLIIQDRSPDNTYNSIYPYYDDMPAQFNILVTFDEDMNKEIKIHENKTIYIKLQNNTKILIDNGDWISDTTWSSFIFKSVFPDNYNGWFKVYVSGAEDVKGNAMIVYISDEFYLDNIPSIESPKIFPNPLDDREIIVLLKSLENLKQNPYVNINGDTVDFNMIQNNWYAASHRIRAAANGISSLSITMTDLNGNIGHWPEDYEEATSISYNIFKTAKLVKNSAVSINSVDDNVTLNVKENSVVNETDIYSMNYKDETSVNSAPKLASCLAVTKLEELEKVSDNIVFAPSISLNNEADLLFRTDKEKAVIMQKVKDEWIYVPAERNDEGLKATVNRLGVFALYIDNKAPELKLDIISGEKLMYASQDINIDVEENGSGIDNVKLYIDGKESYLRKSGSKYVYIPDTYYVEGEHDLEIVATDNAGNKSVKKVSFNAPGIINVSATSIYPNPANTFCQVKYTLNSVASKVTLKIYDVSGRLIYKTVNSSAGLNDSFVWDLIDKKGRKVANGVYFYKLVAIGTGEHEITGKIVVLK